MCSLHSINSSLHRWLLLICYHLYIDSSSRSSSNTLLTDVFVHGLLTGPVLLNSFLVKVVEEKERIWMPLVFCLVPYTGVHLTVSQSTIPSVCPEAVFVTTRSQWSLDRWYKFLQPYSHDSQLPSGEWYSSGKQMELPSSVTAQEDELCWRCSFFKNSRISDVSPVWSLNPNQFRLSPI